MAELPASAERLTARTADGWDLSIVHYGKPAPGRRPVLLLHGIVTNERNLDFDEKHSLARWLAGHGFDVYAANLRGAGGGKISFIDSICQRSPTLCSTAVSFNCCFSSLSKMLVRAKRPPVASSAWNSTRPFQSALETLPK